MLWGQPYNGVTNYTVTINKDGNLGVNTSIATEKLDVVCNVKTSGFVQFGPLTTAERNAFSSKRMVIYNSDDNKFQVTKEGWANQYNPNDSPITGHTKGIGKCLYDDLVAVGHDVVGYSRSNGF